jgi:hypothetical protein
VAAYAAEICCIQIYIKTASTCFGVITIIRERTIRACQSYKVKTVSLNSIGVVNLVVWLPAATPPD